MQPVCNCQGRGMAIIFHLRSCPVRVAAEGQPKARRKSQGGQ